MMLMLAESGSTKTDWVLLHNNKVLMQTTTVGLNPVYTAESDIKQVLMDALQLKAVASAVQKVFFFGAGCSEVPTINRMKNTLKTFFVQSEVEVSHDMQAAIIALSGNEDGICCILGTGSNARLVTNGNATEFRPSLGFVLGDEGSGSWIGKRLLRDYLYGLVPSAIANKINITKEEAIENIYRKQLANRYAASFARILADFKENTYTNDLLMEAFGNFLDLHIVPMKKSKELPIHFTGSIAWSFQEVLKLACLQRGLCLGKVIKSPLPELVKFYLPASIQL